jgi:hypothetical protein
MAIPVRRRPGVREIPDFFAKFVSRRAPVAQVIP